MLGFLKNLDLDSWEEAEYEPCAEFVEECVERKEGGGIESGSRSSSRCYVLITCCAYHFFTIEVTERAASFKASRSRLVAKSKKNDQRLTRLGRMLRLGLI
jgi:hypothetical protein